MNVPKLNFVFSHPIQYKVPLMRKLSENMDVMVHFMSDRGVKMYFDKDFGQAIRWDVDLLKGYKYLVHKNFFERYSDLKKFYSFCNFTLIRNVRKSGKNEIWIIHGWNYLSSWLVVLSCLLFRRRYIISAETPYLHERKKNFLSRSFRKAILGNFFLRFAYKIFYIGKANRAFFELQGINDSKLIHYPYCVDNDFFQQKSEQISTSEKFDLLNKLGLNGKKIILICGKLNHKKRAIFILDAFKASLLNKKDWTLLFVGDGPLKNELKAKASTTNCNIVVTGFINQNDIPIYYSISTIYLMASGIGETWGLATNEAMNFSKPIIISNYSGCSHDLLIHGYNGYEFNTDDSPSLIRQFNKLNDIEKKDLELMGRRSREIIENYNFEEVSNNIKEELTNEGHTYSL